MVTTRHSPSQIDGGETIAPSWVADGVAAGALALAMVWALATGYGWLAQSHGEMAQQLRANGVADAAAQACAVGDAASKIAALDTLAAVHSPAVSAVFCTASGGVDDFGIARSARLLHSSSRLDSMALLEVTRATETAGEAALTRQSTVPPERVTGTLPDGARLLLVPYRATANGTAVGGTAGVVLRPVEVASLPPWGWLLPLLAALAFPFLRHVSPLGALLAGVAAFIGTGLLTLLTLPRIAPLVQPGGVAVVAAEWLVPHEAPLKAVTGSPDLWMDLAAAALAVLLGLVAGPLADAARAARRDGMPYVYAGPAALATGVLVFVPFVVGVGLSFVSPAGDFVGLANYREIIRSATDPDTSTHFFRTLGGTALWTVTNVAFHVLFGLALALLLDTPKLRFRKGYRLLLILPWAVPSYITALTWKWLFNTQYGPFNAMLGVLGIERVDWLGTSVATNFFANLATNVWLGFPFMMVVSLGALQSIPADLYEAATVDGASAWQRFRHVTLPLLKPALFPAVILGTIWTFNAFNVIYLVSGGGPEHKTDILITEAYFAFTVLRRTGLAAAYSVLIFALLLVWTLATNRMTKATENVAR
jgi:ABC-type sugar transport system permease subunit